MAQPPLRAPSRIPPGAGCRGFARARRPCSPPNPAGGGKVGADGVAVSRRARGMRRTTYSSSSARTASSRLGCSYSSRRWRRMAATADDVVLRAVAHPPLVVLGAVEEGPVEAGPEALHRVHRPEEVPAVPDLLVASNPSEPSSISTWQGELVLEHLDDLAVDDELLEARHEPALEASRRCASPSWSPARRSA